MDKPMRAAQPNFSQPVRQIVIMLIIVGLVLSGGYFAWPRVAGIFEANPYLNVVIIFVFAVGVMATFWQVIQIFTSVTWLIDFTNHVPGHESIRAPRLLAPLASLLRSRSARSQISGPAATSILDSVATRMDEARDIARYLGNLLIFLGLLGTFWGLATTVPAVVDTIRSLAPKQGETAVAIFGKLMGGLQAQLGGMGTAFSSSLLGLLGSLVLGLMELFASHGQNRFYRELEEWLSTITRIGIAGGEGEGGFDQGMVVGILDHMAEQVEALRGIVGQSDAARTALDERMAGLATAVERLAQRLEAGAAGPGGQGQGETALAQIGAGQERIVAGQARMLEALERASVVQDRAARAQERIAAILEQQGGAGGDQVDAEARMRLRSIDVQLLRLLEEMTAGRHETVAELRNDIAALTAAVRQVARNAAQPVERG